ncbi:MAG: hypothetical protein IVW52_08980 [Acidimicrobiales bacterium]|nr:hypothetical protein [Acidimicrobiales bacterium]
MGGHSNRLSIPDARGGGANLRVTGHADQGKVVVSHWRDGVCVASTPIELSQVPALIAVLANALGQAVATPETPTRGTPPPASWLSTVRGLLRPTVAKIVDLRAVREDRRDGRIS